MVEIIREQSNGESSASVEEPLLKKNPALKTYMQKFLESLMRYNTIQKIDLIYKSVVKKTPTEDTLDRKLNRILYEKEIGEKIKETEEFLQADKKKFKFPFKKRREMKKSLKNLDKILVFFLTITGELVGPTLYPIYSGNMVIIKNSPYELDPRAVLRFGKYKCIIIKEIDRRPVSNLDLEEVKRRGDATHSDEFLIKAAMKAFLGEKAKKKFNLGILIVIGVIIVGALIYFFAK